MAKPTAASLPSTAILAQLQLSRDCLRLAAEGKDSLEIAGALGLTEEEAERNIGQALKRLKAVNTEYAEQARQISLYRVEKLSTVFFEKALNMKDSRALASFIALEERRAKLMGLDKPLQVEKTVTVRDVAGVQLSAEGAALLAALTQRTEPAVIDGEVVEVADGRSA